MANLVPILCEGMPDEFEAIPAAVFLSLSSAEARQLAGNMMHLASIGVAIECFLLCLEHNTYLDRGGAQSQRDSSIMASSANGTGASIPVRMNA